MAGLLHRLFGLPDGGASHSITYAVLGVLSALARTPLDTIIERIRTRLG